MIFLLPKPESKCYTRIQPRLLEEDNGPIETTVSKLFSYYIALKKLNSDWLNDLMT